MRIQLNSVTGPTIQIDRLEKLDAFVAEIFLDADVNRAVNWGIKIETNTPKSTTFWSGQATTEIPLKGGAKSKIIKVY